MRSLSSGDRPHRSRDMVHTSGEGVRHVDGSAGAHGSGGGGAFEERGRSRDLAIADADKFVETYRREGADVTYHRIRFGGHIIVTVTGAPGALRFLGERFGAQ